VTAERWRLDAHQDGPSSGHAASAGEHTDARPAEARPRSPRGPARTDRHGDGLGLVSGHLKRHIESMTKSTYRVVAQPIISYGVEITEADQSPRVLLTCPTEAAADAWIVEIKRLRTIRSTWNPRAA
jgi:hypothetical protein